MKENKSPLLQGSFLYGVFIGLLLVSTMVIVRMWSEYYSSSLALYGILPRTVEGLKGILLSIWIHGDWNHLLSNALPLIVLSGLLHLYFPHRYFKLIWWLYLLTGFYTWCLGRSAYHIGASGLLYAMAVFIFASGLFRRKPRYLAMSLLTVFLYGSMVWGLLPFDTVISWEAHLAGSISGLILAYVYRKDQRNEDVYEYEWQRPDYVETFVPESDHKEEEEPEQSSEIHLIYTFKPKNNSDSKKH